MKRKAILSGIIGLTSLAALANQQPTANDNPTYAPTAFQPQLRFNIKDGTDTVHFVRDTNDPKIITRVYILKNADPYSLRPYLREMVQAVRVDYNNPVGRSNTSYFNTYNKDNAAKTEKIFVPTGIECIKFADGTGALIVSAEDYRFADSRNGMGIDTLIAMLDVPKLMNSSGQPKFIYFPKNRPARELQSMVKLVGANVSNDTTELIGGKDKIELDSELNCLFFNTWNVSNPLREEWDRDKTKKQKQFFRVSNPLREEWDDIRQRLHRRPQRFQIHYGRNGTVA